MTQTDSGTYNFGPATGHLVTAAYSRVQIRRTELTAEHLTNAQLEVNLMQVEWANRGPLLWTVTLNTVTLSQAQQTVTAPFNTVMLLDAYISIPNGDGTYSDRIITPFSRTEYASQPEKLSQGQPTSFWFNRQITPIIYLWPVPDGGGPYVLNYYTFTTIQDATLAGALNAQIPTRWLDAYVAGLAYRLARIYAPALEQVRAADAASAFAVAKGQDTEGTPFAIQPTTDSYWR
jgi:hypothetical protein